MSDTMITSFGEAMILMRRPNAELIQVNGRHPHWYINGVHIDPSVAAQIKSHSQIRASEDGLLPGLSQTWRLA